MAILILKRLGSYLVGSVMTKLQPRSAMHNILIGDELATACFRVDLKVLLSVVTHDAVVCNDAGCQLCRSTAMSSTGVHLKNISDVILLFTAHLAAS
jgi:hypothetical protein